MFCLRIAHQGIFKRKCGTLDLGELYYVILRTDMSIFKPAFAVVGGAYHQITRGIV